jgi:hypothetical protein
MKKNYQTRSMIVTIISSFIILLASCSKIKPNLTAIVTPPPTPQSGGLVSPVGVPAGNAVTKTIGSGGGNISSADGRFTITIPAGALSSDKTISVQPITNTNVAGTGVAYRTLPDGEIFAKPVTLTFHYTDEDTTGSFIEAMGVAYQDGKGIWQGSGGSIDKVNKTFSVTTTHFTDWALFKYLELVPGSGSLDFNESISLTVYNNLELDELLIPLPPTVTKPIVKPKDLTAKYVKHWRLSGAGTLHPSGSSATYTAPSVLPAVNPSAIRVILNPPAGYIQEYSLVSNIYVGNGIAFRINNGAWNYAPSPLGVVHAAPATQMQGAVVNNGQPAGAVTLRWSGSNHFGFLNWGQVLPSFLYAPGGNTSHFQFQLPPTGPVLSTGGIDFTRYGRNPGEFVMGTFYLDKAGMITTTNNTTVSTPVKIDGYFRVKRAN